MAKGTNDIISRFIKHKRKVDEEFISYVLTNKRKNIPDFIKIKDSFKRFGDFLDWYYTEYSPTYTKVLGHIIKEITSADEMVSIFPNITPWALKEKGVELGKVPYDFIGKKTFLYILDVILESSAVAQLKRIKTLEVTDKLASVFPEVSDVNMGDLSERRLFLENLLKQYAGEEFIIPKHGQEYKVMPLCNPFTKKLVMKITINDNLYILKMAYNNHLNVTSDSTCEHKENQLLRADSVYSNALVDFYIKNNKCKNAADICYYNMDYDAALYKAGESEPFCCVDKTEMLKIHRFNSKYLHDANLLGIFMNDINEANFVVNKKTKALEIIDTGHITYSNPANQGFPGVNMTVGNLSGIDIGGTFGSLFV